MEKHTKNFVVGGNVSQQLEFPTSEVFSIEFSPTPKPTWLVSIVGGATLVCPLIAANVDTFYVSCDEVLDGNLPDYVKPFERNE